MKVTVNKMSFAGALNHLKTVARKGRHLNILSNVLLRTATDKLEMCVTNTTTEVWASIDADVAEKGLAVGPVRLLYDIAHSLPGSDDITLVGEDEDEDDRKIVDRPNKVLRLDSGLFHFTLRAMPAVDFPLAKEGFVKYEFNYPAHLLLFLLNKTAFARDAKQRMASSLNVDCVRLLIGDNSDGHKVLRAVATNGHLMAVAELPVDKDAEKMPAITLRNRTVVELNKLLSRNRDKDFKIRLAETVAYFSFAHIPDEGPRIIASLAGDKYPDWQRVVSGGGKSLFVMDRKVLEDGVRAIATVAPPDNKDVWLRYEDGRMSIESENIFRRNSAVAELACHCENEAGEDTLLKFNAGYLLKILSHLEGAEVCINFGNLGEPCVFKNNNEADGVSYILMRLQA